MNMTGMENVMGQDACVSSAFFSNYWASWAIANYRNATPPSFSTHVGSMVSILALLATAIFVVLI
jgi:hypothetical protein